jgi:predicted ArsR family transcriptional regulator
MVDKAAVLAELRELLQTEQPQPGDVTVGDVAAAAGVSLATAARQMQALCERGAFTVHDAIVNGRRCKVYRKAL